MWAQGANQAPHLQAGDLRLLELGGEDARRPGNYGHFMAKPAQFERKLAYVGLGSAEDVPPGQDVGKFHTRSCFLEAVRNSDDGRKVSLEGRPYQVESRSQRLRHCTNSLLVGAGSGLVAEAIFKPP